MNYSFIYQECTDWQHTVFSKILHIHYIISNTSLEKSQRRRPVFLLLFSILCYLILWSPHPSPQQAHRKIQPYRSSYPCTSRVPIFWAKRGQFNSDLFAFFVVLFLETWSVRKCPHLFLSSLPPCYLS